MLLEIRQAYMTSVNGKVIYIQKFMIHRKHKSNEWKAKGIVC